jgi:hypothetical protein
MLCNHGGSDEQCGAKLLGRQTGNTRVAVPLFHAENSSRTNHNQADFTCRPSILPVSLHVHPHRPNNLANLVHINAVSCASTRASCSRFGRVSFGVEQPCPPAECGREPADAHSVPVPYHRDFSMPGIAILPGTFLFHKVLTTCQTLGIVKDTVRTLLGLTRHYRYVGQTGS